MFSLKRETDYAVQLIQFLSDKKGKKFKSLREFSEKSEISFWFLQKIARKLAIAGIIKAEQGVNGGYKLNVQAKTLNLYKVFEVMEGKQAFTPCLKDENFPCAGKGKNCCLKAISSKLNKEIIKALQKVKIN